MGGAVFRPCNSASGRGNGDLLQKDLCQHTTAPGPSAGHCRPAPLPETPGHSQASLAQSFWGHCSFLLGPGGRKFLLCPPRAYFPGGSQSFYQIPRLGSLLWACNFCNRVSTSLENSTYIGSSLISLEQFLRAI